MRIVQESGVGEVEIEEDGMRVSVRRADERPARSAPRAARARTSPTSCRPAPPPAARRRPRRVADGRRFYRAPEPGSPPFVEEGDAVAPGQTLCILEAMKLMNEVKAETAGRVRAIHVENGEPVEFGQLLFELEP